MDAEIIEFPKPEPSANLTCPRCGGEWWESGGLVIDADTNKVTGYQVPLRCRECGEEFLPWN